MSADHDPEHDRILEQVACEELAPDSDAVRELVARCESCRSALDELGRISRTLEESAALQRDVLEEALGSIDAEDIRLAKRLAPSRVAEPPLLRMRWPSLAAAAVVAISLFAWWGRDAGDVDPERIFLGESSAECSRPVGEVADYDEFAWDWERLDDESFTLVIWNTGTASPIVRESRLKTAVWTPTPQQQAAFGEEIRWEVRKIGAGGEFIDSIQGFALRSP